MFDININIDHFGTGESVIHRVHPTLKVLFAVLVIVLNSLTNQLLLSLELSILCFLLLLISRVSLKKIGIYYLFIMFMVIGLSIMYTIFLGFSLERIITVWLNLSALGLPIIFLMLTTPIIKTLYGIEWLFMPLTRLKIPVNGFILICTIALCFIPTVISEFQRILYAMAVRGRDIRYQKLIDKCKTIMHCFVPLLISTLNSCENLAAAISVKNYDAFKPRTNIYYQPFSLIDISFGMSILLVISVLVYTLTI